VFPAFLERPQNDGTVVSGESKLATAKAKPKAKAVGKTAKTAARGAAGKPKAKGSAKVAAKAKPAPKSAKPSPKSLVKPKAKPAPKSGAKAVTKAVAKPVAKPVTRKAAKTVQKAAAPVVRKTVTSTVLKVETRVPGLLTESELVRQPKGEYMSAAQRKFFKHRLLELQKQMRDNADATTEHLRELAVAPDPADRATQEEEHALELRTRDRERKLLKKIEAALLRIEDGSYGYCEETGDPIGVPRLLARPTATLTIEAQERRELKQKMYGE
jgi:DnaK suppressor protein